MDCQNFLKISNRCLMNRQTKISLTIRCLTLTMPLIISSMDLIWLTRRFRLSSSSKTIENWRMIWSSWEVTSTKACLNRNQIISSKDKTILRLWMIRNSNSNNSSNSSWINTVKTNNNRTSNIKTPNSNHIHDLTLIITSYN